MTVYPVCGHVPMDECPVQFQSDLIAFVERMYAEQDCRPEQKAVQLASVKM